VIDVCDYRYRALMHLVHRKEATSWRDEQEAAGRSTTLCYPVSTHPRPGSEAGQIKRNRQNEVRRQRNKSTRSALRTQIKKVIEAAEAGDRAVAEDAYKTAAKALDQAAAKGVIHRNAAANKKSRLARRLNPSS
jgi:small subunit ribosomal protein S20